MSTRSLLVAALVSVSQAFGQSAPNHIQNMGNLPLSFEPNVGQTHEDVRFFARSGGMTVFFTHNAVVMSLHKGKEQSAIRMKLAGARAPIEARGLDPQEGVSHYFIGRDPKDWHNSVPHYGRISFTSVYDGVDFVAYGNQRKLEYDFVVAPGADPSQVQLAFEGVDSATVNGDGDLLLQTPLGDVVQKRPRVYQNSAAGQVDVAAKYVITPSRRVTFELARYDRKKPLIIDPVLSYSTYLAGSGMEQATGIAVDNTGAAYITGWTTSTDFPHTVNQKIGSVDTFVTKLSAAGNSVVYSTFVGGTANDYGNAIAVDKNGAVYVTGDTNSSSSFPQMNAVQSTFGGGFWDAFVVKLSSTGSVVYSTLLGGNGDDEAFGIAVDSAGSAYVTGHTTSTTFPTTAGAYQSANAGGMDAFVAKIAPQGNQLLYSTYLGGANEDQGRAIAIDAAGAAYVTGWTFSSNFPFVLGYHVSQANTNTSDAFVAKLDPTGKSLTYSTCFGGSATNQGMGVAVDSSGAAYVTGTTRSTDFPTKGGWQTPQLSNQLHGNNDAFVTKVAPAGNSLVYSIYLGGSQKDIAYAIAVDSSGAAYVAGDTVSTDFPAVAALYTTSGGSDDAFVANISPAGDSLVYSTYMGGSGGDMAYALAVDALGAAYVAGYTLSANFPTSSGAIATTFPGAALDDNSFVAKLSGALTPTGAKFWSPGIVPYFKVPCCNNPSVLFAWNAVNGAISYKLDLGSTVGGTNYYSQNEGLATSVTVTVPTGDIYARLTTNFNGVSVHYDTVYHFMMLLKGFR